MNTFIKIITQRNQANLSVLSIGLGCLSVCSALTVAAAPPDINRLQPLNSGPASNQAVLTTPSDEDTQRNNKLMNKLTHLLERTDEKSSDLKQLSPKQRKAAAKLIEQTGSDIRLRVRQGSKTIRYLKVADSDKRLKMSTHKMLTDEVRKQIAHDFLSEHKALLSINVPEDEFVLFSQNTDDLGYSHLRYHQQYNQIPIWPSDATVHLDSSGNVSLFEGTYIATPSRVASTPVVTADDAMVKAKAAVPDADNATVSQAELIYFALDDKPVRLAWKQEVNVSDSSRWLVVIDALDGSVLTAFNEVMNANIVGSGTDLLGVKRPLNVWNQSGKHYLIDTSKKMYDKSSNPPDGDVKGGIIVVDANHNAQGNDGSIDLFHITSNNANSWPLSDGVSASFGLSKTYDYYLEKHNRNSLDGQGGTMLGVVRYDKNLVNAFWNGQFMSFGDGAPFAGAYDVVGHELTHGVTEKTANLVYKNQSGALNESMSDVFGTLVESYIYGKLNWRMGEALGDVKLERDMKDPHSVFIQDGFPYPAKMSEFYVLEQDNGGVHINSSIINHAFYQLAEGVTGAVGPEKAGKIFYRALTTHLQANSQFIDARLAAVQAAEELYGANSTEADVTAKAFDVVEIFEDQGTPTDPNERPPVNGKDATVFLYVSGGNYYLGRREGNDPNFGVSLGNRALVGKRPVVSGDGSYAIFVSTDNDLCSIATDGSEATECLGLNGSVYSVAMTPDANRWAFVLRKNGQPTNQILILDIAADTSKSYDLVAPLTDGAGSYPIAFADSMDFSADGKVLVYDALTKVTQPNGSVSEIWAMYSLDIDKQIFTSLIPPIEGYAIGNPAFAQTTDNVVAFEASDVLTDESAVFAGNLLSGEVKLIGQSLHCCMLPSFNGDDSAMIYGYYTGFPNSYFSLANQPVQADWITPKGNATVWLDDAYAGVIYRRGEFNAPTANVVASLKDMPFGSSKGFHSRVKLSNKGDAAVSIGEVATTSAKFTLEANNCSGVNLAPSAACSIDVGFSGGTGLITANLNVPLDDNKKASVALSGGINLKLSTAKITFNLTANNKDQFNLTGKLTGAESVSLASVKSVSLVLGKFNQEVTALTRSNGHLKFSSTKPGIAALDINLATGTFSISGSKVDLTGLATAPALSVRLNKTLACTKPKLNTKQAQNWTFNSTAQTQTSCITLVK